ncbi:glycosyltransferase family 31 protein [Stipitochalara longipes BDJ]|nr:glycosyltransferase family 31 protein [Stipitochalara longipes BDJ]
MPKKFMYRRLPGNLLILVLCLTLLIFYLFRNNVLPSTIKIPQYLNHSPLSTAQVETPTITDPLFHSLQDQTCTPTTLSLTTTAPCTYPSSPPPSPIPTEDTTPEQQAIVNLRLQGIVIIFKTGAQELPNLAIQLGTTLRYLQPSDILFFSDFQSSLGPFIINDALRNVDDELKEHDPDFEIYRQIAKYQSTGRDISTLAESSEKGDARLGWKLDKYKFLHLVTSTFESRPDAKWYIFIETDSYVFWPALSAFLSRLDSSKPLYLGSAVSVGGTTFAHEVVGTGGGGLAREWDKRMKGVCCGDLALGIALKEKGVGITVAHPLLNGYKPASFTYGPGQHWCQPVVTMHHVLPAEVSAVWRFERRREMLGEGANVTVFAELYHHFVEPHLTESREDWDNLSHGPKYTEQTAVEIEQKAKKEAEERKAKNAKAKEELAKAAEVSKEEDRKDKADSEEKKPEKKEKAKDGIQDDKPPTEKRPEDKPKESTVPEVKDKTPLSDDTKNKEKKIIARSEKEDKNPQLEAAEKVAWRSFEDCRKVCQERKDCFQYVYYDKTCKLGLSFRLGKHVSPSEDGKIIYTSGWMVGRIREWTEDNACKRPEWPDIR